MYDETSEIYDDRYKEIQLIKYSLVLDYIKGRGFKRALDVGCGTGLFSDFLRNRGIVGISTLIGVDISSGMIKRAKDRGYDLLVLGNAEKIPFISDNFDLVVSFTLLQNVHDIVGFMDEIVRVSKKGATIILSILRKSVKKMTAVLEGSRYMNVKLKVLETIDNPACEDVIYVLRRL